MGGSQSCSGSFEEEKIIFPYQKSNYDSSVTQSVAPVTIQNRLINVLVYCNSWGLKLIPGAVRGRPGYKLRYFDAIFYKKRKSIRKNTQQVCTRMALISRCIRCVVRQYSPVPCDTAYMSFGDKYKVLCLSGTVRC